MKEILAVIRRNPWFFLVSTLAALALRFFFVIRYPHFAGDGLVYGDIAKNWLVHGVYGLSNGPAVAPTLIRLPGYPGFLAAVFALFGHEHYTAVRVAQALIDANTCLVIAALALELAGERAGKAAYLLAALCPFTAMYSADILAETLSIFCTVHSLYYGVRGLKALSAGRPGLPSWLAAGIWTGLGLLMRPDGGFTLIALPLALLVALLRLPQKRHVVLAGVLLAAVSLLPLAPWTIRNWQRFHVLQPLPSVSATNPGEFVAAGFGRWSRTWAVDYVSVEEVEWPADGEAIRFSALPQRAFDSRVQYEETRDLIEDYNQTQLINRELDARFARLARERVKHSRFRYYVWLPFLRMADLWLRPRTELLPIESRWWEFSAHPGESAFALFWAGLNTFFLAAALWGWHRTRLGISGVAFLGYVLVRSLYLSSMENPEPRYVLECFPIVLALAGCAFVKTPPDPECR
ncbi:MAG TPA: glycosyltransferase family 39 protein [Candidatus Angelobacter sp.]|nr:glycosyltransferase family 39 protein [Candidatus Angelobacter sp.]